MRLARRPPVHCNQTDWHIYFYKSISQHWCILQLAWKLWNWSEDSQKTKNLVRKLSKKKPDCSFVCTLCPFSKYSSINKINRNSKKFHETHYSSTSNVVLVPKIHSNMADLLEWKNPNSCWSCQIVYCWKIPSTMRHDASNWNNRSLDY